MKIPVVGVDRIGPEDRVALRTELRRAQFSAYEVENQVIAITGQVDVVRRLAFKVCGLAPRVRKIEMDGQELREAHDEPGQFTDILAQKIARFRGLDRAGRRMLRDALKRSGFNAEIDTDTNEVLAEYCGARSAEMNLVVRALPLRGFELAGVR